MSNYAWKREQFIGNCGPQNEAKIHDIFLTEEHAGIIIYETALHAKQCIQSHSDLARRTGNLTLKIKCMLSWHCYADGHGPKTYMEVLFFKKFYSTYSL